jgi:formylglycine-generating enzyme required for sulfatase activity
MDAVRAMEGLFQGKADGQGLGLWERGEAAEAWEMLAADRAALRLPSGEAYWLPVSDAAFQMGRFAVTVHEYDYYLNASRPAREPEFWNKQKDFPFRPVVQVSFWEAEQYCQWWSRETGRTVRLPTSDEWALAAAGLEHRKYPWGNTDPNSDSANHGYEIHHPSPVGLFPAGRTPDGLLDMAGNVWEWTATDYDRETKVVRGGSFYYNDWGLRAAVRDRDHPDDGYNYLGFRCLRE